MVEVVIAKAQTIIMQMVHTGDKRMRLGDRHLRQLIAQGIALQQIAIVEQDTGGPLFRRLCPGGADQGGDSGQPVMPHRTVAHIVMPHDLHMQVRRGQNAQTWLGRDATLRGNDTGRGICAAPVHRKGKYSLNFAT